MTSIVYTPDLGAESIEIQVQPGETVLNALLRSGIEVSNGCRAGVCQSCLLKTDAADIPATAQAGLKSSEKDSGYFLSCSLKPDFPIQVQPVSDKSVFYPAEVISKEWLSPDVICIRLSGPVQYRAGQYLTIRNNEGLARCYSIASSPALDDFIELHIRVLPDGRFSSWLRDFLEVGEKLEISKPKGDCVYLAESSEQDLLLSATGTGLAPLYGIIREALHNKHQGSIELMLGAKLYNGFYLVDELIAMTEEHPQFNVSFITLQAESYKSNLFDLPHVFAGDIYKKVLEDSQDINQKLIYLCGGESFVKKMKKNCFLAGASMKNIHSDAFIPFGN